MTYSIVNHYNHGTKQCEIACFEDFTSAKEFAKKCFALHLTELPEGDYIEVTENPVGKTFAQGKAILRFRPEDPTHFQDLRLL